MATPKKIHVKKNDTVVVISGKDAGKKGKVLVAMPSEGKIIVEGVAMATKHKKPRGLGQQGGIVHQRAPSGIHQDGGRFHKRQRLLSDDAGRLCGDRHVQGDEVGLLQDLLQIRLNDT